MNAGDRVGGGHLLYAEQPVIRLQQRSRALDQHVDAPQTERAVRMMQPFGTPHQLRRQMGADKAVEPRRLVRRQRHQAEARHDGALRELELAAEQPRLGRMKLAAEQRRANILGGAGRRKRRRHQPLALR